MRRLFCAVFLMLRCILGFLLLLVWPLWSQAEGLVVREAWIREAPPVARNHAAYGELVNSSNHPLRIVAVSAEDYGMSMLHKTVLKDGVVAMEHADALEIPAHGVVALAPGSWHIMLMKPRRPLRAGDQVKIVFTLEGGQRQEVVVPVRADR